jgi:tRNA pseudouridine38-40 synthase
MARYLLEVTYVGTNLSGFQVQPNGITVQGELERALAIIFKDKNLTGAVLTGSSRTDAGVHAKQNFFHTDAFDDFDPKYIYNINAILPWQIKLVAVQQVDNEFHCRFNATSRQYVYSINTFNHPFTFQNSWYVPYSINYTKLATLASIVQNVTYFQAFCKAHVQVHTFNCVIMQSQWIQQGTVWQYHIQGNRFLRGMVRGLVATMIHFAKKDLPISEFENLFTPQFNTEHVKFDAPAKGLCLEKVNYLGRRILKPNAP